MSWLSICAVVALVLALGVWLLMGALTHGVVTDAGWNWRKMAEGWWLLAGLFAVFFAVAAGVSFFWRWATG